MLKPIPLNLVTLYADLAQNARKSGLEHGSVVTRIKKGRPYLYVVSKDGGTRIERYIGSANDPAAIALAAAFRQGAAHAKSRRATVSVLKQARLPAPSLVLGRVLEVVANAGLFEQGVILVGTAAFQAYACVVGFQFPGSAIMTNDADLLVASFVATDEKKDLESILQRADPTFRAQMQADDRLPRQFKSDNNFSVDILTKYGRGRTSPVQFEHLGCAAEALSFMEYLAEETIEAVALYGTGVLVRVPAPVRFAIHKLLIAQERRGRFLAKKSKDLAQAGDLIDIFLQTDGDGLQAGLDAARARGPKWQKNINASLRELGRPARRGAAPVRLG